ncbi:MAG TPA: type IV secretory system conjugative DNA transfer family protein [Solirubrobacteraceae bacterium]|nr:type IV secretory system conjugative DNA transfer family protein [Solirubrobacteraceae bacterium]
MRVHSFGLRPAARLALFAAGVLLATGIVSGWLAWCWTQAAALVSLHAPLRLSAGDAAHAMWRLLAHGGWSTPGRAFPTVAEQADAPPSSAYLLSASACLGLFAYCSWRTARRVSGWRAGSLLGKQHPSLSRHALERGWVKQRTWAQPRDLRRLWVPRPQSGRPYLGYVGRLTRRMLAAEPEIQPMVIAPPRAGKSSGFVVPWLLDHDGPALVLSTKRDVYDATIARRASIGEVWVYDPFDDRCSAAYTPLIPARTWAGAIRASEALASAAYPDQRSAATDFWDKEAASMLAPLLHAAALCNADMGELVRWLDARHFAEPISVLTRHGALAAAEQLQGVKRRDERNRETTVMSAVNLLRVYRYPQLATRPDQHKLTPERFLDGHANTIYVLAAGHDQELLRPVILSLLTAVYESAVIRARVDGPLQPRLFMLMDEAANIAPVRNLAAWLSQCGDHGIMIATIWQSIAQIDQRYGRPARDAICAASTAQVFIPPLAEPTSAGYLSELLGEEPIANSAGPSLQNNLSVGHEKAGPAPALRQIPRGGAILIYRDLPPAIVRTPGWFEDRRLRTKTNSRGAAHRYAAPARLRGSV